MENASYDSIAKEYRDSKQLDFRKSIEEYTLLRLAGDVRTKTILDLACGEGIYTRKLKRLGASKVTGVDLSSEMIALAEGTEKNEPSGCEYLVQDVLKLGKIGEHDLVVGMYLLNYATSKNELVAFCKAAYSNLKPGGSFIGFNDNPHNDPQYYTSYRKYGFIKETTATRNEGDPVKYVIFNPGGAVFSFDNFYHHPATYAAAFKEAGFVNFKWEGPLLDPQAKEKDLDNFWKEFMDQPPLIGFSAEKAN